MDSFGIRYNEALRERIKLLIEERLALIIAKKCTSFEHYLGQCEAVQALRDVLEAADETHKKLLAEATGQMEVASPAVQSRVPRAIRGSPYRS